MKTPQQLQDEIERLQDSEELAWGLIANAYGGDWDLASEASGWKRAAERWRDNYHAHLRGPGVEETPIPPEAAKEKSEEDGYYTTELSAAETSGDTVIVPPIEEPNDEPPTDNQAAPG